MIAKYKRQLYENLLQATTLIAQQVRENLSVEIQEVLASKHPDRNLNVYRVIAKLANSSLATFDGTVVTQTEKDCIELIPQSRIIEQDDAKIILEIIGDINSTAHKPQRKRTKTVERNY